jgi:hypothetical protein
LLLTLDPLVDFFVMNRDILWAAMPTLGWLPLILSTATVTLSPIFTVSPMRLLRISMA